MASHNKGYFNGSTKATNAHDTLQNVAGNAKWFNEFTTGKEGSDKRIADVLLRLFHSLALCCAITGDFAMYIAGKLESRPGSITIYIAYHHKNLSSGISALSQLQRSLAFSLGCLEFLLVPEYYTLGIIIHCVILYGVEDRVP